MGKERQVGPGGPQPRFSRAGHRLPAVVSRIIAAAALVLGASAAVAGIALGIAAAQSAPGPDAYTYDLNVDVHNASTTWTGPVPVTMNTNALISGGYVSSTGADILFTDSAHNPIGGVAQDMDSSSTSTWLLFADVPVSSTAQVKAFMDGPPAQPLFPLGGGSDRIEVSSGASLNVTDDLTLEATAYFHRLPSADATIVAKRDAYSLKLRNGDQVQGTVHQCCAGSVTLYPNGSGDFENLPFSLRCGSGSHWQCFTATASTSTAWAGTTYGSSTADSYALDNPSLPAGTAIESVIVYHGSTKSSGSATPASQPLLRLGGVQADGVAVTPIANVWTLYSSDMTYSRPGGGEWTPSDLTSLQAGITLTNSSTGELRVVVTYSVVLAHVRYSPLSAGQVYELKLTRNDPALTLYVDGVIRATASTTGAIGTSTAPLIMGKGITGGVGNVKVCHTSVTSPTCVLDLRFHGGDIESTQHGSSGNGWEWRGTVQNQAFSDNDGTYYVTTSNPGALTITPWGLTVRPQALPPLPEQRVSAVAPEPPLAVFVTPQPSGIISSPFMDPYRELIRGSALPAHAFWMILSTIVAAVVSGKVLRSGLGSMLWAAVAGGFVYFALAYILGIPLAFVAFVAIAYFAAIGPVNFMR